MTQPGDRPPIPSDEPTYEPPNMPERFPPGDTPVPIQDPPTNPDVPGIPTDIPDPPHLPDPTPSLPG